MAQTDTTLTRSALRDEIRRDLIDALNQLNRPLLELVIAQDGPPAANETELDEQIRAGVREISELRVLTRKDVDEAVAGVFERPLPPPPENHVEVATIDGKATVTIATECPECGIKQAIVATATPELLVDPDGRELRIKFKVKGRVHVCGQLPLPDAAEADGQLTLVAGAARNLLEGEETEAADEPAIECVGSNHVPGCSHFDQATTGADSDLLPGGPDVDITPGLEAAEREEPAKRRRPH